MINIHDLAKKVRKNDLNISEDIIYRWSPRNMTGKKMSESELFPLLEAGRYAASGYNNQPWRIYYALRETKAFSDLMNLLGEFNQKWCGNASFLIILVSKKTYDYNGKPDPTHTFGVGAFWQNFANEGVRRNLLVHGMSGFDYQKAKEYLKLSDDFQVEAMVAVGEPTKAIKDEQVSTRKPISEVAFKLE